jgi:hypothetical protein
MTYGLFIITTSQVNKNNPYTFTKLYLILVQAVISQSLAQIH